MQMVTENDIQKMVEIIAAQFQPEKIILFGSYARGTATADSDVDIVVITNDEQTDILDQTAEMQMSVWDIPVAKDILVRTAKQFKREVAVYWTVFSAVAKEGKVLYENAKSA